jgi:TolB-like protein/DNA-binding winged helix-turn-helix (wHTH) protein
MMRIGDWCLDPAAATLSRGGETVPLDFRALRLLLCLAREPGRVVTAEELLDEVWSDVTVSQDSVYQAIAGLRRTLGDDSRQPAYIATVPRKGYRLIAAVTADVGTAKRGLPRGRMAIAAGLALVVVLAFFLRFGPILQAKTDVSLAVLPFLDLTSQSMAEEYVADGVTEELIGRLSAVPGFHVASPTTSFGFKGKDIQPGEIARQLNVAYILDGSLREADGKHRVAVRLVRGKDGIVLWSGSYDSTGKDVLALQDGIADDVAAALRKKLSLGGENGAKP